MVGYSEILFAGNSGRFSNANAAAAGVRLSRENLVDIEDNPKIEVAKNIAANQVEEEEDEYTEYYDEEEEGEEDELVESKGSKGSKGSRHRLSGSAKLNEKAK